MDLIQKAQQIKNETQSKANTALRVGGLFEDIVTPASGRLSYLNATSVSLTANTPKKLDIEWNVSREVNVNCDTDNNQIVVLIEGDYLCYGMLTFTGTNNTKYDIQLRKNGDVICTCNPQTEILQGRETNVTTVDVTDFEEGDNLSFWVVSTKTETINVQRAKIVIKK
jgi:hypothetical protein